MKSDRIDCGAFSAGVAMAMVAARDAGMSKEAQSVTDALRSIGAAGDIGTRSLVLASIMTGIPVGVVAHLVGRRVAGEAAREKALLDEIGYYRGAATGLEREMARQGMR